MGAHSRDAAGGAAAQLSMSTTAAIQTFLRLRPCKSAASHFQAADEAASAVEVDVPAEEAAGYVNNKRQHWNFKFNGVLERDATIQRHAKATGTASFGYGY